MIIRNNRRTLITLEYSKGGKRMLALIGPGKQVNIPQIRDLSDILSKNFFSNGWLSEVKEEIEVESAVEHAQKQVEVYADEKENKEEPQVKLEEPQEIKPKKKKKNNNNEQN